MLIYIYDKTFLRPDKQQSLTIIFYLSKVTCGAELALLFVEILGKGKVPYDEEILGSFFILSYTVLFLSHFFCGFICDAMYLF